MISFRKSLSINRAIEAFTLVEVLASSVIIVVATIGAIAAFNLITSSIRGTGVLGSQNRAIDRDLARITEISELYGACTDPSGSIPAPCPGQNPRNSYYYFPDDPLTNQGDVEDFFAACRSDTESEHITDGFIQEVGTDTDIGAGVSRSLVERVDSDHQNHLVRITWTDEDGEELRSVLTVPLVSSWCP